MKVEAHRHEAATGGQGEIDIRYDDLIRTADNVLKYKYVVKNVARRHGKTATFMPKPLFNDHGSAMHVHVSLWKNGNNLFAGSRSSGGLRYAGLSDAAEYAIGGLLKHAPALCAFSNPTTNSYKRLVPGFDAPINLAYSQRNRSAAIRIPVTRPSPSSQAHRVSLAGRGVQSVPDVCRHADGDARRHQEQDPPRRAARQGHLRSGRRGTGQRARHADVARRVA